MEYTFSATPLVVVAGTPGTDNSNEWAAKQPLDEIPLLPAGGRPVDLQVVSQLRARLAEFSQPVGPWDPQTANSERLHFHFAHTLKLAANRPKPSVLSPLNKDSPVAQPIFTPEWLRKYFYFMPTTAIMVAAAPVGEAAENKLVDHINDCKARLAPSGVQLLAIVVGNDNDLMSLIPFLRRQTGLPAKTGLIGMADDFTPQELDNLASSLYQTLLVKSQDFFALKMRDLRNKRKAVAPPLDLLMWDARFTLKLAFCSEFKGDNSGALKLYESAYDTLSLLFVKNAITVASPAYVNAREVMDAVALKVLQTSLPSPSSFDKFRIHLLTVERIAVANNLNTASSAALLWRGMQYARFAQLCSIVQQTSAQTLSEVGGTPPGLVWLDAAKLFATKPQKGSESQREDPYIVPEDDTLNAQQAFLNAISDLSGMPRAKSYALTAYGDWLSGSDESAAMQAYKTSAKSLPEPAWPEVQRYLSHKLNDSVMLFTIGDTSELPSGIKTSSQPFFKVLGTFEKTHTYVGREVKAQVTLDPLFPHRLVLERLRIRHSLGQIDYIGSPSAAKTRLVKTTEASLDFSSRQPITFEFPITALETGDVELIEVEFIAGNEFTQRLPIGGIGMWLDALPVSPRTIRHLPLTEDYRKTSVDTRPAKIDVKDATPPLAAVDEKLQFALEFISNESEAVEPEVSVRIGEDIVFEKKLGVLAPGGHASINGIVEVPAALFRLVTRISYNTTTDTLPVTKIHSREIDIARPFRVNFDLMPELLEQEWPAFFAPTLELPHIARKWRLRASILSLFTATDLVLQRSRLSIECDTADFDLDDPEHDIDEEMGHNSHTRAAHAFVARRHTDSAAAPRNLEAFANMELLWWRKSSPDIVNVFKLAPVRLNLPTQEPRVLCVADKRGDDSSMSQVTYHVENATSRTLSFSVSMASSTFFAFQGPKVAMLRMLPYSSRALRYQLVPLGDGAVQNRRPLPELRVYDVNYRRTLAVLSGDESVTLEQGSLFI